MIIGILNGLPDIKIISSGTCRQVAKMTEVEIGLLLVSRDHSDHRASATVLTYLIVGEFSLSTNNDIWDPKSNKEFYKNWFGAQVRAYEKQDGWVGLSWV